ncbi:MAG: aldose 1-epimerase family protein [Chloroflexota bacterium]
MTPMQPGKPPELPSGEQYELRYGSQRAVVVEVGAGIREYEVDGQAVLDGYPEDEMVGGGRGAILAPWPNRIRDGAYELDSQSYQLALTEADKRNAIHGLVRWVNWTCAGRDAQSVRMRLLLHPQPGYPFALSLEAEYALTDTGLRVSAIARNVGASRAPYGIGHHPYLRPALGLVDNAHLRVPARSWLELDERGIPTGQTSPVDGSDYDFRRPRPIGALKLDTPYADLERDANGLTHVRLDYTTLWLDHTFEYVQVFTGDTVQPVSRRRQGLAVEPMTCAPDAFRNGLGLRVLEPGQSLTTAWGIMAGSSD